MKDKVTKIYDKGLAVRGKRLGVEVYSARWFLGEVMMRQKRDDYGHGSLRNMYKAVCLCNSRSTYMHVIPRRQPK